MEKQNSYSHILKYTSLFGGVQGLNIIISLVRNKLVALILGPTGMGVVSLFTSTTKLVGDATNLGLPIGGVRRISETFEKGDYNATLRQISIFRMWYVMTAILGMLLCICLSPFLSKWTFAVDNYSIHFILLSPVVALTAITAGEMAVLKATRCLHDIAVTSVFSVISALVITIPIYMVWGMEGIVPVLVLATLAQAVITLKFSFRQFPLRLRTFACDFREGKEFAKLGVAFVVGCVFGSSAELAIRSYLNFVAHAEIVGLYNAAYMMVVTYAGIIFTAMETDYFPRLSAISIVGKQLNDTVNRQIEVSLLLLSPMLVFYIVFMPVLLPLLFSGKFMQVLPMLQVATLSMCARVVFLPIEYISLSRADSFSYLLVEFLSYGILVTFVVFGYQMYGLLGTGIGMALASLAELLIVLVLYRILYKFVVSKAVFKSVAIQTLFCGSAYALTFLNNALWYWTLGSLVCGASLYYSLSLVRRETDILENVKQKILKKLCR